MNTTLLKEILDNNSTECKFEIKKDFVKVVISWYTKTVFENTVKWLEPDVRENKNTLTLEGSHENGKFYFNRIGGESLDKLIVSKFSLNKEEFCNSIRC